MRHTQIQNLYQSLTQNKSPRFALKFNFLSTALVLLCATAFSPHESHAQSRTLTISGVQGSAGVGFTDITVKNPSTEIKFDRGTYLTAAGEKGFNVANLYLTISLGYMDAEGSANYRYTNLSSSRSYSVNDVAFKARMMELSLGLKMKLIDNYWFRPYVEGGGIGSWHEMKYTSRTQDLQAIGNDYKSKDTVMGNGLYGEAGFEIQFSERFGVKLAGRLFESQSKKLETLNNQKLKYRGETYYMAALVGF